MKFNEKLIELRKKEGLSQEELGYKLNVTRQTVSKWELGQTTPEMDKLVEMSKIFNVSVDELVNETENVSTETTVIEDQTIGTEGTKENKVKFIIIGVLVVVLIWIVVKMVTGFTAFNKVTDEQGFFDKFFSMVDKFSSQQQNIMEDSEGTFGNVQEIMGNAEEIFNNVQGIMGNTFGQVNTTQFNSKLELYKGSISGMQLKKLLDEVNTSNKTEERKVTVKYMETETQDTEIIKNLKTSFDDNKNFEVSFEYDEEGYIYEVSIERVFSKFEINSFNSSFEIFAGSKMGGTAISVLDDIITSNKTEERKITVKYRETETQNEQEIKNIRNSIDRFEDYDIAFEYDEDGFINKAIIERIS